MMIGRRLVKCLTLCGLMAGSSAFGAQSYDVHVIAKGESFHSLASEIYGDGERWREIWAMNPGVTDPDKLIVGQKVRIPSSEGVQSAQPSSGYHTVKAGDTLSSLAQIYLGDGQLWRRIWAMNPSITNPDRLMAGTRLKLPVAQASQVTRRQPQTSAPLREARLVDQGFARNVEVMIGQGYLHGFAERYRMIPADQANQKALIAKINTQSPADLIYARRQDRLDQTPQLWGLYRTVNSFGGGILAQQLGTAEVQYAENALLTLKLSKVTGDVALAEYLLPIFDLPTTKIYPQPSGLNREARILRTFSDERDGAVVLLDAGSRNEVKVGDMLYYYKKDHVEQSSSGLTEWPTGSAGIVTVFAVWEGYAFAKVVRSGQPPSEQDRVLRY